jgi:hypothetical protein
MIFTWANIGVCAVFFFYENHSLSNIYITCHFSKNVEHSTIQFYNKSKSKFMYLNKLKKPQNFDQIKKIAVFKLLKT